MEEKEKGGKRRDYGGNVDVGRERAAGASPCPPPGARSPGRLVPPAAPLRWNLLLPFHLFRISVLCLAF